MLSEHPCCIVRYLNGEGSLKAINRKLRRALQRYQTNVQTNKASKQASKQTMPAEIPKPCKTMTEACHQPALRMRARKQGATSCRLCPSTLSGAQSQTGLVVPCQRSPPRVEPSSGGSRAGPARDVVRRFKAVVLWSMHQ